ncbi:Acetyltransferase (GNAT) domain-containing protein [Marinobacter sp. es.042]|uniref:GNAT family N-acetyltransferase n=1 Tax=Marinobacter sp. es.042 TaxID=1761794 RepID=UPI000B4FDA16|nr:GNAT family N-acetyltransferase [Marinobacter sp. es.042]SNB55482.1 Acetyltransferase (GNAT) domain-containing protein [Marinobacter sp. es.042]
MSLFQTQAWQSAWWDTWGAEHSLELRRPWGQGISGIYSTEYKIKGLIPIKSLEFVGSSYRKIRSTRTEYNRFSVLGESADQAQKALEKTLFSLDWSEAVFNDLPLDSSDVAILKKIAIKNKWLVRTVNKDSAWAIRTEGGFENYLRGLGSNTRLRLFNRRKVLESLGEIVHENYADKCNEPTKFFEILNRFHLKRWGKPVYTRNALKFNSLFLRRIKLEGGEPQLLIMKCFDEPISALYNVKYNGCVYNLQSGFEQSFHNKLALGTLHLGYAIEQAFLNEGVQFFDFLAGSGKNENYKKRIATESMSLISLMIVRSTLLKTLYSIKGI